MLSTVLKPFLVLLLKLWKHTKKHNIYTLTWNYSLVIGKHYDNWAFNVWTENFIKTLTTINTEVNCNMLFFDLGSVCIVTGWGIHSHPHTGWCSQSQTFYTFSSYLYVYLSKAEYASQSKFVCIEHTNYAQLLKDNMEWDMVKLTTAARWNPQHSPYQKWYYTRAVQYFYLIVKWLKIANKLLDNLIDI